MYISQVIGFFLLLKSCFSVFFLEDILKQTFYSPLIISDHVFCTKRNNLMGKCLLTVGYEKMMTALVLKAKLN